MQSRVDTLNQLVTTRGVMVKASTWTRISADAVVQDVNTGDENIPASVTLGWGAPTVRVPVIPTALAAPGRAWKVEVRRHGAGGQGDERGAPHGDPQTRTDIVDVILTVLGSRGAESATGIAQVTLTTQDSGHDPFSQCRSALATGTPRCHVLIPARSDTRHRILVTPGEEIAGRVVIGGRELPAGRAVRLS